MADVDINDLASLGLILDIPSYQLPPEAWTTAQNVRILDDGVLKGAPWEQLVSTSGFGVPYHIHAVKTSASAQWLMWCDLNKIYAWDGTTIADVSGPSQPYATVNGYDWVSTDLAGAPIFTNNVKVPQYWPALALATPLADMPNWTAALGANSYCKSIRAFGPYLVALNVTLATVSHPHGVLWSHPADPGSMPASWDYTDPTRDAGFTELSDADAGAVVDGLPLRGQFIIYKENATWLMRLVGGQFIMQFDPFLIASGVLAPHCAALTGDGKYHCVLTGDDLIIHDGITAQSLLDKRMRRTLFNRIDISGYPACHVFAVPTKREMWIAYPEIGATTPTRALIWNYGGGGLGVLYESEFSYPSATVADVLAANTTWDADTHTWDSTSDVWDVSSRRRTVLADPVGGQILEVDLGSTRAGIAFTGTATRENISMGAQSRTSGQPVLDNTRRRFIRRIWPKCSGAPVSIRVGFADILGGTVTWSAAQSFDPSTQMYLDFTVAGRSTPSVDFQWSAGDGTLYGYRMEIFDAGKF